MWQMNDKRWAGGIAILALIVGSLFVAGCGGGGSSDAGGSAEESGTLNLLSWEGYTEPQWVKPFEKANHVKVNISYVGSDDELFAKVHGGGGTTYDLVATNRANLGPLKEAGLIEPLDESKLENFDDVYPDLNDSSIRLDGKLYAAPFVWGSIPLIYSTKDFPTPPDSWDVVFEPPQELCGKVLLDEDASSTISLVAMYLGFKDPYNLTDEQLDQVKQVLEKTRECTKAFYSGFGDAANYFASGDVATGISLGGLVSKLAGEKGASVKEVVPKEGALGWMDTWAISKGGAEKEDLAYKWINWEETPKVQKEAAEATFFGPTVEAGGDMLDPELQHLLHLDEPDYLPSLTPMRSPEGTDSFEKRIEMWNLVKAG
jgi:putative spermidine/putrescine transport system substrate-binding protein/spermidine/putrescine transport system substrate-binding protein